MFIIYIRIVFFISLIAFSFIPNRALGDNPTPSHTKKQTRTSEQPIYQRLRQLYQAGQQRKAKEEGLSHLKQYPKDVDVMLVLGFFYLQEKNYSQAEYWAALVLQNVPTYEDARRLLIMSELALKKFDAAKIQIQEGLKYAPKSSQLQQLAVELKQQTQPPSAPPKPENPTKIAKTSSVSLEKLKKLKNQGRITEAKRLALQYLSANPKDVDVMLILGLIYYQEQKYSKAHSLAQAVIKDVPRYTDASVLLIRTDMALNNFKEAEDALYKAFKYAPSHKDLNELKIKLAQDNRLNLPRPPDYHYIELAYKQNQGCANTLLKVADCFNRNRLNFVAAAVAQDALMWDGQNKKAQGLLKDIASISPKYLRGLNEVGFATQEDYVNDIKEWWNYSTFYYSRHLSSGDLLAMVNYASRLGVEGTQEEIILSLFLNKNARVELDNAFSDTYELYPRLRSRVEGFFSIPNFLDFSVGECYAGLKGTYYSFSTASLSKETEKIFLSARFYHYLPKEGRSSTLFIYNFRRFLKKDNDNYLWATIGTGRSPDLNDLLTVNFIIIKNNFISLGYHFPIMHNKIALNIGGDYQRQIFPSGRVREIMGGIFGVAVRF